MAHVLKLIRAVPRFLPGAQREDDDPGLNFRVNMHGGYARGSVDLCRQADVLVGTGVGAGERTHAL